MGPGLEGSTLYPPHFRGPESGTPIALKTPTVLVISRPNLAVPSSFTPSIGTSISFTPRRELEVYSHLCDKEEENSRSDRSHRLRSTNV